MGELAERSPIGATFFVGAIFLIRKRRRNIQILARQQQTFKTRRRGRFSFLSAFRQTFKSRQRNCVQHAGATFTPPALIRTFAQCFGARRKDFPFSNARHARRANAPNAEHGQRGGAIRRARRSIVNLRHYNDVLLPRER
ncbi:MAG: hypothetical protein DBX55_01950 [Verrucomicrobia bacterium]|nr:MAG: hypothetical protein DBX55_01950 [Verrucomicrobiota bacterium]